MSDSINKHEYEYESQYGGTYSLIPKIDMYASHDNLSLRFLCRDEDDGYLEPFCSATVNLIPLDYLEATIDTNDNGDRFLDFLENNGFGTRTKYGVPSGMCIYPVFQFNEERIKEIDSVVFAEYQKAHGRDKQPLAQAISNAEAKLDTAAAGKDIKEPER